MKTPSEFEERQNSKETRPDLPQHWKLLPIGDVTRDSLGTIAPMTFPDEEFEYYSIPAFQSSGLPIIEKGKAILSNKLLVSDGTVLFGKLNPRVLKVWLVHSQSNLRKIASTEFLPILPDESATSDYIYFVSQSDIVVSEARRLVSGSTPSRQRVDPSSFYAIEIPLPPVVEQKLITRVLRGLERTIECRTRELSLERERKAALFERLFTIGFGRAESQQTSIGIIPADWKVVRLSEVAAVKTSFPPFSIMSTLDSRDESETLVLGLKVSDMNLPGNERMLVKSQTEFRITSGKLPKQCLKPHSIVFPKRGAAIATNKKRLTTTLAVLDPNLIAFEPGALLDARFAFAFFERFDLRNLQDNTPVPQLNKNDVEAVLIPLPPLEEQRAIGELSETIDAKIAALNLELELLGELFRALLNDIVVGRVSIVPLLGGESAS